MPEKSFCCGINCHFFRTASQYLRMLKVKAEDCGRYLFYETSKIDAIARCPHLATGAMPCCALFSGMLDADLTETITIPASFV